MPRALEGIVVGLALARLDVRVNGLAGLVHANQLLSARRPVLHKGPVRVTPPVVKDFVTHRSGGKGGGLL